jgi:hypothetical protein
MEGYSKLLSEIESNIMKQEERRKEQVENLFFINSSTNIWESYYGNMENIQMSNVRKDCHESEHDGEILFLEMSG